MKRQAFVERSVCDLFRIKEVIMRAALTFSLFLMYKIVASSLVMKATRELSVCRNPERLRTQVRSYLRRRLY